jgi:acyl-CoA thioesterase-1
MLRLYVILMSAVVSACAGDEEGRKVEFVYAALGASDVIGVGASPLTEGYVYLLNHDLQLRIPGTFLINVGVPGARIDSLNEEVLLLRHFRGRADLATVWIGVNDLVDGVHPSRFQSELRVFLRSLQSSVSTTVVIANLPDVSKLAVFRETALPTVTAERVKAFNHAIAIEAPYVNASIVDVFDEPAAEYFAFDGNGFHPTEAGHRRMAALFRKTILERLGL